jgi:hypothetical protein
VFLKINLNFEFSRDHVATMYVVTVMQITEDIKDVAAYHDDGESE